jgi:hypothetical protein
MTRAHRFALVPNTGSLIGPDSDQNRNLAVLRAVHVLVPETTLKPPWPENADLETKARCVAAWFFHTNTRQRLRNAVTATDFLPLCLPPCFGTTIETVERAIELLQRDFEVLFELGQTGPSFELKLRSKSVPD